ncbi:thioredoxin domain-containing protein [Nematostella vectensis]|uniref:thioredoxin domain-containing protein n=1 Tax=Nematostella vectensis TaxID=45351 RepID=UPI0020775417|nr:thioredoxin domain-containing protein [Nematostella vectensis]
MARNMFLSLFSVLFCLHLLCISLCQEEIKILDDDSFEHLTQASTGSTTGDWLIAFSSKSESCEACKKIDEAFLAIQKKFGHKVVVAKVLQEQNSKLTWKRFEVHAMPKISFFRRGSQYFLTQDKFNEEDLTAFIENFEKYPNQRVPDPIGILDVYVESVMEDIKHVIHIRKNAAALIFCSGALFGVMLTPMLKCIGDFLINTFAQEPDGEDGTENEDCEEKSVEEKKNN